MLVFFCTYILRKNIKCKNKQYINNKNKFTYNKHTYLLDSTYILKNMCKLVCLNKNLFVPL